MTTPERLALRERYGFRCGYCGVHETDVGAELTVDHFRPRSRGGTDEADNLVYCCHACNEFKGDCWRPDVAERLLHPHLDPLDEHLRLSEDGTLVGLTATGAFHIRRLRLNRAALVEHRKEQLLLEDERAVHRTTLAQLSGLEEQVADLRAQLEHLEALTPHDLP